MKKTEIIKRIESDIKAGGFLDNLKRKAYNLVYSITKPVRYVVDKILPNSRDDYPPSVRQFLAQYQQYEITALTVERKPVSQYLTGFINQISGNEFNRLMKKYGFDKLYHLSLVFKFTDRYNVTRTYKIEKNEVINIEQWTYSKDAQYMTVDLQGQNLTIQTMLAKTRQFMGDSDFFLYDTTINKNDCQGFINGILNANDLMTPELKTFIYQNTVALMKELPEATRKTIQGITKTGTRFNRLIYGKGLRFLKPKLKSKLKPKLKPKLKRKIKAKNKKYKNKK